MAAPAHDVERMCLELKRIDGQADRPQGSESGLRAMNGLPARRPGRAAAPRVALARILSSSGAPAARRAARRLDEELREATQFELVQHRSIWVTFGVWSLHDQEEAMTLSTRIGVMNAGQIVQVGTPQEIYEFPSTRFIADFIGSVNMLEGQVIEDEPDYTLIRCAEAGGNIYVSHGISCAPGATAAVAVPAGEDHRLAPTARHRLQQPAGTVQDIAYLGDLSIYRIRLDTGKIVKVTMPDELLAGRAAPDLGGPRVSLPASDQRRRADVMSALAQDAPVRPRRRAATERPHPRRRSRPRHQRPRPGHRHPLHLAAAAVRGPLRLVAKISVSQQLQALPPYTALIQLAEEGAASSSHPARTAR